MYIRVKENTKGTTHLEVKTYYSKGGYSCLTYTNQPRGYYVSVTPVRKWITESGVGMIEFTAFTGYKHFIQEATRFNKNTLAKLDKNTLENAREMIDRVLAENGLELAEDINEKAVA